MARPDKKRNNQLCEEMAAMAPGLRRLNAIAQVKISITEVRIAVARFESTWSTPIFAKMAVAPAKSADNKDQTIQFIF